MQPIVFIFLSVGRHQKTTERIREKFSFSTFPAKAARADLFLENPNEYYFIISFQRLQGYLDTGTFFERKVSDST